jgi:hypothetical protein
LALIERVVLLVRDDIPKIKEAAKHAKPYVGFPRDLDALAERARADLRAALFARGVALVPTCPMLPEQQERAAWARLKVTTKDTMIGATVVNYCVEKGFRAGIFLTDNLTDFEKVFPALRGDNEPTIVVCNFGRLEELLQKQPEWVANLTDYLWENREQLNDYLNRETKGVMLARLLEIPTPGGLAGALMGREEGAVEFLTLPEAGMLEAMQLQTNLIYGIPDEEPKEGRTVPVGFAVAIHLTIPGVAMRLYRGEGRGAVRFEMGRFAGPLTIDAIELEPSPFG